MTSLLNDGIILLVSLEKCFDRLSRRNKFAVVAELADALDSGSSGVTTVEVRVLSSASKETNNQGFEPLGFKPLIFLHEIMGPGSPVIRNILLVDSSIMRCKHGIRDIGISVH